MNITINTIKNDLINLIKMGNYVQQYYEESIVDKFKSNLLLMIFWLNIINYNS